MDNRTDRRFQHGIRRRCIPFNNIKVFAVDKFCQLSGGVAAPHLSLSAIHGDAVTGLGLAGPLVMVRTVVIVIISAGNGKRFLVGFQNETVVTVMMMTDCPHRIALENQPDVIGIILHIRPAGSKTDTGEMIRQRQFAHIRIIGFPAEIHQCRPNRPVDRQFPVQSRFQEDGIVV